MCICEMFIVLHNRVTESSWLFWMSLTCSCWQVQVHPYIKPKGLGDLWVANRFGPGSPQWSESPCPLWFFPLILAQNILLKCRAPSQILVPNLLLLYIPVELKQLCCLQLNYSALKLGFGLQSPALPRAEQLLTLCAHPGGEEKQLHCFPSGMTEKVSSSFF